MQLNYETQTDLEMNKLFREVAVSEPFCIGNSVTEVGCHFSSSLVLPYQGPKGAWHQFPAS